MARRKSKAKQQEKFAQGLLGLVLFASVLGTYSLTKSFQTTIIVTGLTVAVYIAILSMIGIKQTQRLKRSGIAEIDKMEGIQFERYLNHLFQTHGYKTQLTKAAGDYGADLLLLKSGRRVVVQAKRYSKNVGIQAVQEAQASIAHYKAAEAWVVTNSDYTDAAYELAKSNRVKLINREGLIDLILSIDRGSVQPPAAEESATAVEKRECPRCGHTLLLRNGPSGSFYGCSSFPKCRYTEKSNRQD
ncbi:restriction endonuclease [Paenibacillus sp. JCM 10914]|uniref:restriction endonuclease n=1 Tax=Paenibacillus sp. JCM 10914 TaxID=1236974 RepID=UPI0003CCAEF1|nr:restriction endonuclease [Paenibacillus sp. JCM 10914]GAE04304.1 hypothetical protein JCM10914_344 [Paenibacillus sp. JCM 10914]